MVFHSCCLESLFHYLLVLFLLQLIQTFSQQKLTGKSTYPTKVWGGGVRQVLGWVWFLLCHLKANITLSLAYLYFFEACAVLVTPALLHHNPNSSHSITLHRRWTYHPSLTGVGALNNPIFSNSCFRTLKKRSISLLSLCPVYEMADFDAKQLSTSSSV